MTDSRPDSRVSGPTIMSAGSRKADRDASESPVVMFRSAMDIGIVIPTEDSTHQARIISGGSAGAGSK